MRRISVVISFLALASCGAPDTELATLQAESRIPIATAGAPGVVTVPTLPSAGAALGGNQILCDSYQLACGYDQDEPGDDDDGSAHDAGSQCVKTALSFYQELQVQLVALPHPITVSRALLSVDAQTTFLFPDGSYTQGASAYRTARPELFNASQIAGIQNKFVYKPLNKDTIVVIGNPTYSLSGGAAIDSVQYHVYTRSHQSGGACRSLSNLAGRVCWSEVAGQWTYAQPFTGTSIPHSTSTQRSPIPTAPTYPTVLEPGRIVCDGAFRARHGDTRSCEQTAREFYKEIEFQVLTLTNPDTVTSGVATLDEATTFVYPTGLVTEGVTALGANTSNLFGLNWFPVGIENKFLYKAIDSDTVLFIGDPLITMFNFVTGQLKTTESVQTSLYRRNTTSLGNCRSAANPSGDVCWTEIAEQWVYGQPVLGN